MTSSQISKTEKQFRLNRIDDQSKLFAKCQKDLLLDLIDEARKLTDPTSSKQFVLSFTHGVPSNLQADNFIEMFKAFSNTDVELKIVIEFDEHVTKFFFITPFPIKN